MTFVAGKIGKKFLPHACVKTDDPAGRVRGKLDMLEQTAKSIYFHPIHLIILAKGMTSGNPFFSEGKGNFSIKVLELLPIPF